MHPLMLYFPYVEGKKILHKNYLIDMLRFALELLKVNVRSRVMYALCSMCMYV